MLTNLTVGFIQRHVKVCSSNVVRPLGCVQELQCTFLQICTENPGCVLKRLLLSEPPDGLRRAQTFIRAQALSADSVAQLLSSAVVQALLASTQELQPGETAAPSLDSCLLFLPADVVFSPQERGRS